MVQFGDDEELKGISKYLQSRKLVNDYKKNPEKYTKTADTNFDFSKLTDESLIDMNQYYQASASARDAIEQNFGGLDEWFGGLSEQTQKNIEPLWDSIKNGSATCGDVLKTSFGSMPVVVDSAVTEAQTIVKAGTKRITDFAKTAASFAGNIALNIALTALVSYVLPKAIEGFKDLFFHSEQVIKKGKEAKTELDNIYDSVQKGNKEINDIAISVKIEDADTNSVRENLDALAERYAELKQGVNEFTNANKNLSSDKYQEYLDICNKIAKQYPELVKGYDSQGNAILRLGDDAESCKEELLSLYNSALNTSLGDIGETLKTAFDGVAEEFKNTTAEAANLNIQLKEIEEHIEKIKNGEVNPSVTESNGRSMLEVYDEDQFNKIIENIQAQYDKWAKENGSGEWDISALIQNPFTYASSDDKGPFYIDISQFDFFASPEEIQKAVTESGEEVREATEKAYEREAAKLYDQQLALQRRMQAQNAQLAEELALGLRSDPVFQTLNESVTDAVLSNIGQFDFNDLEERFDNDPNVLIDYIVDLIAGIPDEIQEKIAQILNKDYTNLTIDEYFDTLREQILKAVDGNEDLMVELFKTLGLSENVSSYYNKRTQLFNWLEPLGMTEEQLMSLDLSEIDRGLAFLGDETIKKIDDFYAKLNAKPVEVPKEGLLSEILGDETYTGQADTLTKKLTALGTAIEYVKENGALAGDALTSLLGEGIDMKGDYSLDALNEESIKTLTQWVNLLHEQADAKDLGEAGLSSLNDYVRGLIESYQQLNVSAENVQGAMLKVAKAAAPQDDGASVARQYVNGFVSEFNSEFKDELLSEEDRQILFYLAADPEAANWTIEQWRKNFDNAKITFHFVADTSELDKRYEELTKAMDIRNAARGNVESKNALAQAGGRSLTSADYDSIVQFDEQDMADLQEQWGIIDEKLRSARQKYAQSRNTDNYWKTEIDNLTQQLNEAETAINNAEAKQLENLYARESAPLENLKKELADIQRETQGVQQEITKLENNGKSATSEQYDSLIGLTQDQISNLNQQKQFQQSLMSWLADNQDFGVDSTYYTQAQDAVADLDAQIVEAEKTIEDTRTKLEKIYSSTSFEYLLTNTDSDKGVQQIYATFEGFISKYKGYVDQIKNGEKIDFSAIIAESPEFAGVDNIEEFLDRVGQLNAEKLVDFVNDFSVATQGLDRDSEAFDKAASFLASAIKNIDFNNIDIDAQEIQDLISSKIFNAEAIEGKGNYKAVEWANAMFAAVKDAIQDGKDVEAFIEVSMMPDFYEMTPEEVIEQMGVIKAGVELEITNAEEFRQHAQSLADELAQINADRDYTEALRSRDQQEGNLDNMVQYFEQDIESAKKELAILQQQRDDLYDKNNPDYKQLWDGSLDIKNNPNDKATFDSLISQRLAASKELTTQITNLQANIDKLEFDKLLSGADKYDQSIEKLQTSNKNLMTQFGKFDEYTKIPDSLFNSIQANLYSQAQQYQLKTDFYETLLGTENLTEAEKNTLNDLIAESKASYEEFMKQMQEYAQQQLTDAEEKELKMLQSDKAVLQSKQQDRTMTKQDYADLDVINERMEQIYSNLYYKTKEAFENLAEDDPAKNAMEMLVESFETEFNNIKLERNNNEDLVDLIPVQAMEKNLAIMQETGESIKKEISDVQEIGNEVVPDSMYKNLADNAQAQIEWIKRIQNAYELLAKAETKNKNYGKAKEYRDQAKAFKDVVDQAEADIRTSEEGMASNRLNEIQTEAQKISQEMDRVKDKMNDAGKAKTLEDYQEALEVTRRNIANLTEEQEYWNEKLNDGTVVEGSEDWKTYSSNLATVESNLKAAREEQEQFNESMLGLRTNEIQKELEGYNQQLEDLQNRIKMNEAKGIKKSAQDFVEENALYDQIAEAQNQLAEQIQQQIYMKGMDGTFVGSEEEAQMMADKAAALLAAFNAELSKAQNEHEQELLPIQELQDELAELQTAGSYIQREYDKIIEAGGELSDEQYAVQVDNLDAQRDKLVEIQHQYQALAELHKGDSFGLEMLQALDSVQGQIDNIDKQELDIDLKIDNRELTHLQNGMVGLENEATKFKDILDNTEVISEKRGALNGLIRNNQEQMQNLAAQAAEYRSQMEEIAKKYEEGGELYGQEGGLYNNTEYIRISGELLNAENSMDALVRSTLEYKAALESLPVERINASIENNEAKIALERAKIAYKEATGEEATGDDFTGILAYYSNNIKQRQEALEIAQKAYDDAKLTFEESGSAGALVEEQKAHTDLVNAQSDLISAQTDFANVQAEATQADRTQIENSISLIETKRGELEAERQLLEAAGMSRTGSQISEDLDLAYQMVGALRTQLQDLDSDHSDMKEVQYEQQRLAILQNITKEEAGINALLREQADLAVKSSQDRLAKLELDRNDLDRQIAEYSNNGREVPNILLEAKIVNIEDSIEEVQSQIDNYSGITRMLNIAGVSETDPIYKSYLDMIDQLKADLTSLTGEKIDTQNIIDEKPLLELGYQLDDLKTKGEELQKTLNKEGTPKFARDYQKAIENVIAQNENLSAQAEEIRERIRDLGLSENDPEFQTYKNQLKDVDAEQKANIETIKEWQLAINMLNFDHAISSLDKYIAEIEKGNARQDNQVSLGYRMTLDDYVGNRDEYAHVVESARRTAQDALNRIDKMELENPWHFAETDEYKELQATYDSQMELVEDYTHRIQDLNKEIVWFPVEELQREQKEIQRVYDDIERDIEELNQAGFETPENLLTAEKGGIDNEIANLEAQRDKMLEVRDKYALPLKLFGWYDEITDEIDSVDSQLDALADKKREIDIEINERPLDDLQENLDRLQNESSALENRLNEENISSLDKGSILKNLEANAKARLNIIQGEMAWYNEELNKLPDDANYNNNDQFKEYQDALDGLKVDYSELTKEVKEYGDAINNLPTERLERQRENNNARLGIIEAQNGVIEAAGGHGNYSEIATGTLSNIDLTRQLIAEQEAALKQATDNMMANMGKSAEEQFAKAYEEIKNQYNEKLPQLNEDLATSISNLLDTQKQPITELETAMDGIKNKASSVSGEVEALVNKGLTGTREQYQDLVGYNIQQIENIDQQIEAYGRYREVVKSLLDMLGYDISNNTLLNSIDEAILQLDADTRQLKDDMLEYQLMLNGGRELNELSNQMKSLEMQSSMIDDQISQLQALNQNIPVDVYKQQIQNTRAQIANLRGQNEYLREQQSIVGDNRQKYVELEEQIQQNTSSISSMITNLNTYDEAIDHFASNTAASMSEAISSALSESMSQTGLSNDTMNQLMGQFKQLAEVSNIDLRSMFIQSANGIQVNISALRKLVNAQKSLTKNSISKQIAQQNNQLIRQVQAYKNTSNAANQDGRVKRNAAKQNLQGINTEVRALGNEINSYYALQKMMEDQMSGYQKWQNALQTPNAGDHYKEVYQYMETITEALKTGETGTDDFISFFRDYVSREGRHSPQYAHEQWDWIYKYFTEDRSGIENFLNDLVSRGFATNNGGTYSFDLLDTEALKQSFGWTDEFLKDIFGRAQDYGLNINYVTSYADGMLQVSDAIKDVIQAQEYLAKFDNDPTMSAEGRAEWLAELSDAERQYYNLVEQMNAMDQGPFSEKEYNEAISYVNNLVHTMQELFGTAMPTEEEFNNMSEAQQMAYREMYSKIMDIAEQYHLDLSSETFEVNVDTNSYEESLARVQQMQDYTFENGKKQLEELQATWNTNVDLNYNFDESDNLEEMEKKLLSLKDLRQYGPFDMNTDVQALETLNRLIENGENAVDFKIVLDTSNLTKEQFDALTDEQKMEAIELAFQTHTIDSTAQEILNYADGLEIPTTVQIDQESVDALGETLETSIVNALDRAFDLGIDGKDIIENINSELAKINEFGVGDHASEIISGTIQSKFGNIDMDKRHIIEWSEELKQTYKDALESWQYDPEIGSIDTVFGGSGRFGEDKLEYGVEVAFSPILQTENGTEFLNKDTLYNYIETLIGESTENGQLNIDKMFELDAQGREIGGQFVQNVIAAIDESIGENNEAVDVGSLLHFSGDFGAIELAFEDLQKYFESTGMSAEEAGEKVNTLRDQLANMETVEITPEVINTESVTETINNTATDKNAKILLDAEKSPEFDDQFDSIVDEIETKKPELNVEITSDNTQVDTIVTEIEAHTPPKLEVEITSNIEQINNELGNIGTSLEIPVTISAENLSQDVELIKADIGSEENKAVMIIDGNSEPIRTEAFNDKAGIEATIAKMQIGGTSELVRQEVQNDVAGVEATRADMKIGGNSRDLFNELNRDVGEISRTYAEINVGANGVNLFNSIQNVLNNSTFTATVNANVNANLNISQLATGTMTSIATAPAHATGSIALKHDEDALVNELNTESIIRDGQWFEIPGGMHIEHLKKNDIILNHVQTKQLKESGKASGKGKIVGGQAALAQGTAYSGMPAHSSLSGFGSLSPTYPDLVWHTQEESLPDYNDGYNDAGDKLNDAADDFSDGVDDLIEKSKQLFDFVELRLNWLDRNATRIANRFNEWMTDLEKSSNLKEQLEAVTDQLEGSTRAAIAYARQANLDSLNNQWVEETTNGDVKTTTVNYFHLYDEIPVDDLLKGKFSLEEIDTSTPKGQAVYDSAQHYLDLINKARNANDSIDSLANSLGDLYSQMIQLPFDQLEKSMSKLERTMQTLSSITSAAQSGESGLKNLENALSQVFGKSAARNVVGTLANHYQMLNVQIDKNLDLMKQEVEANKVAWELSAENVERLDREKDASDKALERARAAVNNAGVYMDDADYKDFVSGNLMDLSHFGTHGPVQQAALINYNSILAQNKQLEYALKEAEERVDEQYDTLMQQSADYAAAMIQSVFDKLANVDAQYSTLVDYQQSLNNLLKQNQDYLINWEDYLENSEEISKGYTDSINNYGKQIKDTMQNLIQQRQILQEEIARGFIAEGTKEWYEAQIQLNELDSQINELKVSVNEAYSELANVPNKIVEEKFNDIEDKYKEMISALNSGIDSSRDLQRGYQEIASLLATHLGIESPVSELFAQYEETFQGQNRLMTDNMKQQTERLMSAAQGLATTKANLDYAMAHRSQYTAADLKTLEDAYKQATEAYQEELMNTAQMQSENAKQALDNIESWYNSLLSREESVADAIERDLGHIENSGTLEQQGVKILENYEKSINNSNKQARILQDAIATAQEQLNYNIERGWWKVTDEAAIAAANSIDALKAKVDGLLTSTQQLFQNWVDMPSQIASANISAANAYENLVADENGNVKLPTQRELKQYASDQYANAYYTSEAMLQKTLAETNDPERIAAAQKARNRDWGLYLKSLADLEEQSTSTADTVKTTAKDLADKIAEYYDKIISYLTALANAYGKVRDVMEELGRTMDEHGNILTDTEQLTRSYTFQIDTLMEKLQEQSDKQEALKQQLDKVKNSLGENSMEYKDLQNTLANTQIEIMDTLIELDQLKDAFRETIYFKPFEEAIEKIQQLKSNIDAVNGLISDTMKITRDGEYTQLGQVSLTLDIVSYNKSLSALQEAVSEYYENDERHARDASYSDEEYLVKQNEIRQAMLQNMQDVSTAREKIIQQEKNRYSQEISYIKELISAQKDELAKRKELADYDRNLKDKTKAIQQIEREIASLEGLDDMRSKSQLQRLKAQRDEASQDLNDTVQNHVYEMRQDNLDKLQDKLDEDFDSWSKDLEINIDSVINQIDATADALGNVLNETNAAMQTYLGTFGPNITNRMVTGLTNGLTYNGELNTPNREEIKNAANTLVHYYGGLTAQEFDTRFGLINDDTSKQLEEQQKIEQQAQDFETTRLEERKQDLDHQKIREETMDSQYGQLVQKLGAGITEDGVIVVGLEGNAASIAQATSDAQKALADANRSSADSAAKTVSVAIGDAAGIINQKIVDMMPDEVDDSPGESQGVSYEGVEMQMVEIPVDKAPSITVGTKAVVNPKTEEPTKQTGVTSPTINQGTASAVNNTDFWSGKKVSNEKKKLAAIDSSTGLYIRDAVQNYKLLGYSSAQQVLNAIVAQKKLKVPTANGYMKSEVEQLNAHRKDYTAQQIKDYVNVRIHQNAFGISGLKKYASGTLSAHQGLAQVFENGPEIITTKKGTFIPFQGGEGVIPARQTQNLMALAKGIENGTLKLQMPDMSAYTPVAPGYTYNNNASINIDSLITINGNADQDTVNQIQEIAQSLVRDRRFQENVTKFVSQRQTADGKMAGRRTSVK